jgi:hypothetical protein
VLPDRAERFHAAVEAELNEERSSVLARVGRQLELARTRAEALGVELDEASEPGPEVLAEHRAAHAEAVRWRWVLCVQREAIGLYDHRWVDATYPVPRRR